MGIMEAQSELNRDRGSYSTPRLITTMSLAQAAESRKERLIALRKRRLGQQDPTPEGEE